jgi:hypothetical protein
MSTEHTSATARVQITIELPAGSTWGNDCTVDQIYKQAGEETVQALRNILSAKWGNNAKIIDHKVTAVFAQRGY